MGQHLHRAAMIGVGASLAVAMSGPASSSLPNLRPAAPIELVLGVADDGFSPALRFDTTTWNVSDNHLDLVGVPVGADEAIASQCLEWIEGSRACGAREEVGRFVFHPSHAHFHFDGYAAYELRSLLDADTPDFSEQGLLATGGKTSFCLMDTDASPEHAGSGPANGLGFYLACFVGHQGISARWGDTYWAGLEGQQIVLPPDLDEGQYAVVIHVNPDEFLRESDHDDNVAWTTFTWTGDSLRDVRRHDDVPARRFVNPVPMGPGASVLPHPRVAPVR